jgi:arylsulfatase
LFDIVSDPGETRDVRADHPEVVADLALRYDRWWESLGSGRVNESAIGPRINPFKAKYWSQFGGGPSDDDLRAMDLQQNPATRAQITPALPVNTR